VPVNHRAQGAIKSWKPPCLRATSNVLQKLTTSEQFPSSSHAFTCRTTFTHRLLFLLSVHHAWWLCCPCNTPASPGGFQGSQASVGQEMQSCPTAAARETTQNQRHLNYCSVSTSRCFVVQSPMKNEKLSRKMQ